MRIISATTCISAILLLLAGCANRAGKSTADTATTDTAIASAEATSQDTTTTTDAESEEVDAEQTAMLKGLLSVNGGEDAERLRECCTRNALNQLHEAYEYDDIDDNSLALWAINGRDVSDAKVVLTSLEKVAPDTYQAQFKMVVGEETAASTLMEYRLAKENGDWKIDSYRQIR